MQTLSTTLVHLASAALLGATVLLPRAGCADASTTAEKLGPNIVANGGFDIRADPGAVLGIPAGAPYLTNWIAVSNEVRVIGTFWQAEEGTRSLSLATAGLGPQRPSGDAARRQRRETNRPHENRAALSRHLLPGRQPVRSPAPLVRMQIGGYTKDFTYQSGPKATSKQMDWVQRSLVYTATSASTTLTFYAYYTPGNDALGLDNVQVRAIQPAPAAQATVTPAAGA